MGLSLILLDDAISVVTLRHCRLAVRAEPVLATACNDRARAQ